MNRLSRILALVVVCLGKASALVAADMPIPIEVPAHPEPVSFEKEILPILRGSCIACHHGAKAAGQLVLESPHTIQKGGEQGPAVVPGKGAESLLLQVAAHQRESFMPPAENMVGARPLTSAQLGLLKLWIDQGATGTVSTSRNPRWQGLPAGYRPIFATAVTPDGQFAACGRGNRLFVYDLPTAKLATMLSDPGLAGSATPSPTEVAHADVIRALAFDARGDLLASGGFREVKLWRRPRVRQQAEWLHDAPVQALATSSDGRLAATGDENGRVRIWDVAKSKTLQSFVAHSAGVTALTFSADSKTLFSGSSDKSLRAWNVADGSPQGKPVQTASPLVAAVVVNQGQWLVTGQSDGLVHIWEVPALLAQGDAGVKPLREIKAHGGPLTALAAIPSQPTEFVTGGEDGLIRRWNGQTGEPLREMRQEGPVTALAVPADSRRIASAGARGLRLWNGEDGQMVFERTGNPLVAARPMQIEAAIAFTQAGIANAQQDIKNYEGPERRVMVTAGDIKKAEEELVKAQKTRDEKKQALDKLKAENKEKEIEAADNAFQEAETAVVVAGTVIGRAKLIAERAVKELADAQSDVLARQERLKQQEEEKAAAVAAAKTAEQPIRSLAFSADGSRLVVGCQDGAIHVYDTQTGTLSQTVTAPSAPVRGAAFAGVALITTGGDQWAILWNADPQWRLERVIGGVDQPAILADRVLSLDFSPDRKWLATGGGVASHSGELKIFSVADGNMVREFPAAHGDSVLATKFSPDGRWLASAGADRMVRICDAATGENTRTFAGHTAHVLGLSWKADGKLLASCGADKAIKLWDVEKGLSMRSLKGTTYQIGPYKRDVTALWFLGESEEILAASGDGTVRLHRTTSDSDMLTFTGSASYQHSACATPDGRTVLSGGSDGILHLWTGHNQSPVKTFEP